MWLKKLKIAVIEKNADSFEELLKEIPKLRTTQEIEEALYLIDAAKEVLQSLKKETQISMIKMKKHIDFLNSTKTDKIARFDITS